MIIRLCYLCMLFSMLLTGCHGFNWNRLNLPHSHVPYFFTSNSDVRAQCMQDDDCPYKSAVPKKRYWGYERDCPPEHRMSSPDCPEDGWGMNKKDQIDRFWKTADFGYVSSRQAEMKTICRPVEKDDSMLECSWKTHYCRAKNLFLDLRNVKFHEYMEDEDFLAPGNIGGHCELHDQPLRDQEKLSLSPDESHRGEMGQLQSWIRQLKNYRSLPFKPTSKVHCDYIIKRPTIFMKLSPFSGTNLYRHFCDFINLYISQHINNSFSTDIALLDWNEGKHSYKDWFADIYKAFTDYPVAQLRRFQNKTICFKDVMFPLPPNIIKGMFFNMPLISGCYGSSLFKAFSEHILHRLQIEQKGPHPHKVRMTFLARGGDYRKTVNKEELFDALKNIEGVEATFGEFEANVLPFLEQVKLAHNSDVLIGVHGAGLTHMLFQPDWGAIIELHNCSVPVYYDLSRLRGLKYFTLDGKDQYIQHIKCKMDDDPADDRELCYHTKLGIERQSDYTFNVEAFIKLATEARDYVNSQPEFLASRKRRHSFREGREKKDEL